MNGRGNPKSNRSLFIEFFSAYKVTITSIQFISRRVGICAWLIDNCGFSSTTVRYFFLSQFQRHQFGIPCISVSRLQKSNITLNDEDHSATFTIQEDSPALQNNPLQSILQALSRRDLVVCTFSRRSGKKIYRKASLQKYEIPLQPEK